MSAWRKGMFLAKTCQNCEYLRVCGGMCLWSEPCGRC
jgi:radical SAM protein with 4Fe4S-binding SPASM domain